MHGSSHWWSMARATTGNAGIPQKPFPEASVRRAPQELTVYLLLQDGKAALRQREDRGLLAGLWEFPHVPGELEEANAAGRRSSASLLSQRPPGLLQEFPEGRGYCQRLQSGPVNPGGARQRSENGLRSPAAGDIP